MQSKNNFFLFYYFYIVLSYKNFLILIFTKKKKKKKKKKKFIIKYNKILLQSYNQCFDSISFLYNDSLTTSLCYVLNLFNFI